VIVWASPEWISAGNSPPTQNLTSPPAPQHTAQDPAPPTRRSLRFRSEVKDN